MTNLLLKAKYSFISTLIFFIVANPETYKFTRTIFGPLIDLTDTTGLLLHTVIFFFAMFGLMMV